MTSKQTPFEYFHAIRTDISRMAKQMNTLTMEMRATRQIVAGMASLQDSDHVDIDQIKKRIERLERRLGDRK